MNRGPPLLPSSLTRATLPTYPAQEKKHRGVLTAGGDESCYSVHNNFTMGTIHAFKAETLLEFRESSRAERVSEHAAAPLTAITIHYEYGGSGMWRMGCMG